MPNSPNWRGCATATHPAGGASADRLEARLQAIVDELLPGKRVQPDDNLFEIGVSSMALVQIHERIDREFPGLVELAELFDHPTIGDLARHLEGRIKARLRLRRRSRRRQGPAAARAAPSSAGSSTASPPGARGSAPRRGAHSG